jgi:hypothetical protein
MLCTGNVHDATVYTFFHEVNNEDGTIPLGLQGPQFGLDLWSRLVATSDFVT